MVKQIVTKHYDWKMGLIGALIMGGVVFWINVDHGFWAAVPAMLKQAAYTMIAGGCLTRLCERIVLNIQESVTAHVLAMLIPSVIAIVLTLGVHYMRGTPEPLNSTIPTMVLAPISFALWGWHQRRRNWEPSVVSVTTDHEELVT
ncbi:MAG: hypothetical protein R3301_14945 [Saprospiraceae bacterium]|nr:hypothetical protein [Saprospiraceae bacterium]